MLDKGPTFGTNGSIGSPEKRFSIDFNKAKTKFCLSLHYNVYDSYLFVNGKEISFVSEAYLMDLVLLSLEK